MLIYQISEKYNRDPYFKSGDLIAIADDRVGRILSFKLYEENEIVYADFKESSKTIHVSSYDRYRKNVIASFEDFQYKWSNFYNDLSY